MNKVKVLVVDDSAIARQVLTNALKSSPLIDVVGSAPDPYAARDLIVSLKPDVVTLDVQMPRMDGITFLKKLMKHFPIPVVMVSSLTQKGAETTIAALEAGAVEVVPKPVMGQGNLNEITIELVDKVIAASRARVRPMTKSAVSGKATPIAYSATTGAASTGKIIAIGASTGGTEALKVVLTKMPTNAPGVVVVQHMPETFTKAFAERLNSLSAIYIKEAVNGDKVATGTALIAPGGKHMILRRNGAGYSVEVKDGPLVNRHRPSVEALFNSVAAIAGDKAVGVILTGMGADGAEGMLRMKDAGASNIAQDEESCVVFGMPKEAIKLGGVHEIKPLDKITETILRMV